MEQGLKFSVSKTHMLFTKDKRTEYLDLKLYDQTLERVPVFKYLAVWLYAYSC